MTGIALLVAAWAFIADLIFQEGKWLQYLGRRAARFGETWQPRYPVEAVASSAALILAGTAVLWVVLTQPRKPLWIRAGATSLVMFAGVVVLGLMRWHTDSAPHQEFHLFWLFCMSTALGALSLGSGVARIVKRVRTARSG